MTNSTPSIMIIAGDPSGDQHASHIVRELKARDPAAAIWGIGGPKMADAGFEQVMPFEPFNCMGYAEVVKNLKFFLTAKKNLIRTMSTDRRPDVLVCVDYSGFNIPMMKAAHKLEIPVVWYIPPMVWAWKRKRAKILGRYASHIAAIFPFENKYFEAYRAPVTFAGNPVAESLPETPARDASFINAAIPTQSAPRLAVIPGSRAQEIKNMLPPMLETAAMFKEKYPAAKITVSKFHQFSDEDFKQATDLGFDIFTGDLRDLLQMSDIALVTSGTATLETALMGVPMAVAYRTSKITYAIYKAFVKINHISLPNIIAEKTIVPECIQNDANPKKMFDHLNAFIMEPNLWQDTANELSNLRESLGERKPSQKVSDIIQSYLD